MRPLLAAAILTASPVLTAAQDFKDSILYAAPADTTTPSGLDYVSSDPPKVPKQPSIVFPMLGGAAGAVAGMYGGAFLGASLEEPAHDITPGMVYGFLAGEMLLLPVGVHLANGRKGSFLADLAVSVVIGTSAVFATSAMDDGTPLVLGALAQYADVIAVERATAKRRLERRAQAQAP